MSVKNDPTDNDSIAMMLEETEWDYRPKDEGIGLLSPMSRYFRGFPWDGKETEEEPATPVFPLGRTDSSGADFSDL
ncbi:MAG: hypothetical protein GY906_29595 [bacterium]|nr:hypothetical protein [bacterium]